MWIFSAEWIPVFDTLGKDRRQKVFNFVQRGGQGALLFNRIRDDRFSQIPSEYRFPGFVQSEKRLRSLVS